MTVVKRGAPGAREKVEFVAVGKNIFGFGETEAEAIRNAKRIGGSSKKQKFVIYKGCAEHDFTVSHLDGGVSWYTQDVDGNELPAPERTILERA